MFQWSWLKISTTFISIHEDSNNAKDSNLGWSKSMVGGTKKSVFLFFSFTQVYHKPGKGKVPKLISTSVCRDTPVTVGKPGNVRSGKQAMLTQRSNDLWKKKKETNQLKSQYLIGLRRWLDYQWPSWVGFHCKARYNQHPWKQYCLQGRNVQLDSGSNNSHGCFPLDYS